MPMRFSYILSTRPVAAALVYEAAARGVLIDSRSFIATEQVEAAMGDLASRPVSVVFTSGNAVAAVKEAGSDWKVFCLGNGTRRKVLERFGDIPIAGTAESATELAQVIIRAGIGQEVYFFCGDKRREELPAILRQAGQVVHEIVVYRTLLTPQKVTRAYAGIAFYSPSTVESFFSVNTVPAETVLFVIGKTTAAAVQERSDNQVIVAGQPDKEEMIRGMIEYFQHKNRQH